MLCNEFNLQMLCVTLQRRVLAGNFRAVGGRLNPHLELWKHCRSIVAVKTPRPVVQVSRSPSPVIGTVVFVVLTERSTVSWNWILQLIGFVFLSDSNANKQFHTIVHWHCIRIQQIKRIFPFNSFQIRQHQSRRYQQLPTLHPNSAQRAVTSSHLSQSKWYHHLRSSGGPKTWPGGGHPKLLALIDCSQQVWSGTFFQRQGKTIFKDRMSCEAHLIEMLPASHFHESSPSKQGRV